MSARSDFMMAAENGLLGQIQLLMYHNASCCLCWAGQHSTNATKLYSSICFFHNIVTIMSKSFFYTESYMMNLELDQQYAPTTMLYYHHDDCVEALACLGHWYCFQVSQINSTIM